MAAWCKKRGGRVKGRRGRKGPVPAQKGGGFLREEQKIVPTQEKRRKKNVLWKGGGGGGLTLGGFSVARWPERTGASDFKKELQRGKGKKECAHHRKKRKAAMRWRVGPSNVPGDTERKKKKRKARVFQERGGKGKTGTPNRTKKNEFSQSKITFGTSRGWRGRRRGPHEKKKGGGSSVLVAREKKADSSFAQRAEGQTKDQRYSEEQDEGNGERGKGGKERDLKGNGSLDWSIVRPSKRDFKNRRENVPN